MTDVTTAPSAGFTIPGLSSLGDLSKRGDLALAIGVLSILMVLILPLPAILLDFSLAISIILSVLILMTSLFIHAPLEFSSFPTVLLISTMLRLALNLASTRLILSHGHEGTAAAGHVIEAFGNFVMGGNFVIGIIVFTILVIVNFVVITKGSGRIAEVAARFNLDAMPGKQMAIDADLSAGLITEQDARTRRKHLEDESAFFGAMDGASKFVRGDAIAGLLVVFINVIGGMIIGIAQQGLAFSEAARTYTLLTVGDGLVTQIPALIVSTAAGLLVSKAGIGGGVDKALLKQLSGYPKALGMSSAVMIVMSLLPGLPMLPFLALGGGAGALAYMMNKRTRLAADVDAKQATTAAKAEPAEEPISTALKIDDLKIELGYALLPLVNAPDGSDRLTEQIKALRRSLASEMGFVMPAGAHPRQRAARGERLCHQAEGGRRRPGPRLAEPEHGHGPGRRAGEPARPAHHRADVRPARHLGRRLAQGRSRHQGLHGGRCRDRARHAPHRSTQDQHVRAPLLRGGAEAAQGPVEGTGRTGQGHRAGADHRVGHPARAPALARRAHLDPRPADHPGRHRRRARLHAQPCQLVEHVRTRLARQICAQHTSPNGYVPLIALSPKWEQAFAESIVGQGDDKSLAMAPSKLSEFITLVRERFEEAARQGEAPVLVTSPGVRPFVRSHRRAVPHADDRALPSRNSPAGAPEDGRRHLGTAGMPSLRAIPVLRGVFIHSARDLALTGRHGLVTAD